MMVFLPADAGRLRAWRDGAPVDCDGFAATPAMLAAHEFGTGELEDAEYVALGYASVASLVTDTRDDATGRTRWVAAVDFSDPTAGEDAEFGLVRVTGARWRDVTAIFVDEPDAAPAVGSLAPSLAGRELTDVLTDDAVLEFVAVHDLLWHLPSELDTLA